MVARKVTASRIEEDLIALSKRIAREGGSPDRIYCQSVDDVWEICENLSPGIYERGRWVVGSGAVVLIRRIEDERPLCTELETSE